MDLYNYVGEKNGMLVIRSEKRKLIWQLTSIYLKIELVATSSLRRRSPYHEADTTK